MRSSNKNYILGFDIGASRIKAVLVHDGKIVRKTSDDTPQNFSELLEVFADLQWELLSGSEVKPRAVGIAVAGVLDKNRRRMLVSPNMRFLDGKDLRTAFIKRLGIKKVKIEHDVHASLRAEMECGAARGAKNIFCLAAGSGIGSALAVSGKIIYGEHGAAGEVGRMLVASHAGERVEFEDLASNKFIHRNLGVDFLEAFRRVKEKDQKAAAVFAAFGENLGIGVANIVNILNPQLVVIGGGIVDARVFFEKAMRAQIAKYVLSPLAKKTRVAWARTGNFGGALGAALAAGE